jgi:hypothetical protein
MNDWILRHIVLTREERWLIASILLIALCGIGVMYYRKTVEISAPAEASRTAEMNR